MINSQRKRRKGVVSSIPSCFEILKQKTKNKKQKTKNKTRNVGLAPKEVITKGSLKSIPSPSLTKKTETQLRNETHGQGIYSHPKIKKIKKKIPRYPINISKGWSWSTSPPNFMTSSPTRSNHRREIEKEIPKREERA
jgi:hypothetical protein